MELLNPLLLGIFDFGICEFWGFPGPMSARDSGGMVACLGPSVFMLTKQQTGRF